MTQTHSAVSAALKPDPARADLRQIAFDFDAEPEAAEVKYGHGVITLGHVDKVDGLKGAMWIHMHAGPVPGEALVNAADESAARALDSGDIVALNCQSAGRGFDAIVLIRCRVIPDGETQ